MRKRADSYGIMKRFTAFAIALSMVTVLSPAFSFKALADDNFSGGSGTESDPYVIATAADLKKLSDDVNSGNGYSGVYFAVPTEEYTYTETNSSGDVVTYTGVKGIDIDLSEYSPWTPIGTEAHPFRGHFDGGNGTNKGNTSGKIQNYDIKIDASDISDEHRSVHTAGLFGYASGAVIEYVEVKGETVGDINLNTFNAQPGAEVSHHSVGAVVGFAENSEINYCSNHSDLNIAAVMGNDGGRKPLLYSGGIVGGMSGSTIFHCINYGKIDVSIDEDSFEGKLVPDFYTGGITGGVNNLCADRSGKKIHGSENSGAVTVYAPVKVKADNMKIYTGGIVGGAYGLAEGDLEIAQCYNKNVSKDSAKITVTTGTGLTEAMDGDGAAAFVGGIFGYDDADKAISVHDNRNDGPVNNTVVTDNAQRYAGGIVAGRGDVGYCMNTAQINCSENASGISYSVPHNSYSSGTVVPPNEQNGPICAEIPEDTDKDYFNYFESTLNQSRDSNAQHFISKTDARVSSGELTWLLQGDDVGHLHWVSWSGAPVFAGGYDVQYPDGHYGDRPLDYWYKIYNWQRYEEMMRKEIVSFAYAYAWNMRVSKTRFVAAGEGNDGVDPVTGEDLKADSSFESYLKSDKTQFYDVIYGNYTKLFRALPTFTDTDSKTYVQWQTASAAEDESAALSSSAFDHSAKDATVYAVGRVKFEETEDSVSSESEYGEGSTVDLSGKIEYAAKPDGTSGKFRYSISDASADGKEYEDIKDYFAIDGTSLKVSENTPVGEYTITVRATEIKANYTLFSADVEPVLFEVPVSVTKADPVYTAPSDKTRKYNGAAEDLINAGYTTDGTILYKLSTDGDEGWSDEVPKASAVDTYTVNWKLVGDSNHNDVSEKNVSGVIIPDSEDEAHAIIVRQTDNWDYDGEERALANVTSNPANIGIEWSTDNTTWTDTIPTATDAGKYPVYWRTKANAHGVSIEKNFEVEVRKAKLDITAPKELRIKYDGESHALVTGGSVKDDKGVMKYSLNPEVNNWSDSNWSENIPTAVNAGDYTVYYRVFPSDEKNYDYTFDKDNMPSVTSAILTLTEEDLADSLKVVPAQGWTYDGVSRKLVNEDETKVPTDKLPGINLMYSADGGTTWDYTIPTAVNADTYNIKWKLDGNKNVDDISGSFTVVVEQKDPGVEITENKGWRYNGTKYPLLTEVKKEEGVRLIYSVNGADFVTTIPEGQAVGVYTVLVKSQPNKNYKDYQGTFTIECTAAQAEGSVKANDLTFNYGRQELVRPEGVTNGKMMYKADGDEDYSENIPERADAGTYKVWYYVKGTNANYKDTEVSSADVTIKQLDTEVSVNKSEGLVYNGESQTLLTVDTADHHGKVLYMVQGGGDYSEDVPKRANAGTYTVLWKVADDSGRSDGQSNLVEKSGSETVTIEKYQINTIPVSAVDLMYTGEMQPLLGEPVSTVNNRGTVKYAVTGEGETPADGDWTNELPKRENAGRYVVWYKAEGDDNMNGTDPASVTVEIKQIEPDVRVSVKGSMKYKDEEQDLISSAVVNAAPGGGTLLLAVTEDNSAAPDSLTWSQEHPKKKNNGTYYVWYKFDGDDNTKSIAPKKYTSVISGNAPDVEVSGKTLTYTGEPQPLAEGKIDGGGQLKYFVTSDDALVPDAAATDWKDTVPAAADAGVYHVWYYVPAEEGIVPVGPARVESVINKAQPPEYDFSKDNAQKLSPDGKSFTVPWGTRLGSIELGDSRYAWSNPDTVLSAVGTFPYMADFTDPDEPNGNYQSGKVRIMVTVTPTREATPNIKIDYITEMLTGFNPSRSYTLWQNVTHSDSTSHAIADQYMNDKDASIVLRSASDNNTDSAPQHLIIPSRPEAPKTDDNGGEIKVHQTEFLTALGRVEGISDKMEYSVGDSGTWISGDGSELSLPQNTTVQIRKKAVADTSFKSLPLTVKIEDFAGGRKSVDFGIDASINYPDHAIVLEPNTKYTIIDADGNKHRIETDEKGETPIDEEWHKTTVQIVRNGDILYTVDSEPKELYIKERPEKPDADSEEGKITNVYKTDEYRPKSGSDKDYKNVETDGETNETAPGEYVVRVKATETTFSSLPSDVTVREKTPNPVINYEKAVLGKLDEDSTYVITDQNGVETVVTTNNKGETPIDEDWFGTDIQIRKKGKTDSEDSDNKTVTIINRPPKPTPDSWDSKITAVDKTMEYRLADNTAGENGYTDVEHDKETKIVVPDDYEVRVKATENSFASLPAPVTVDPLPAPSGNIDYPEVKIKDLEKNEKYIVIDEDGNEETFTADDDGKIPIREEWMGTDIELIRIGDDVREDSDPQVISIPRRPDAPNPSSRDSKITNVDDTMEYRPEGDSDDKYTAVENGKTESPVVDPDDYVVRVRATETSFPSLPARVTVESGGSEPSPVPTATAPASVTPTPAATASPRTSGGGRGGVTVKATAKPSPSPTPAGDDGNSGGGENIPELNEEDHFAYVSGYEDGTFRPDRTITRGEAAVIFARLTTDFDAAKSYAPTPDLTEDMFFYPHVSYLHQRGIITGYEDGTFRPWNPITRAEFAVIASKFAKLTDTEENVFKDVSDDFWGKSFILLAHKNGWVDGYEDGTFRPDENITRAEVVSVVNRMLERSCDTDYVKENIGALTVFSDMSDSHWAYNDVLEASNGHLYVINDGEEAWTDLK